MTLRAYTKIASGISNELNVRLYLATQDERCIAFPEIYNKTLVLNFTVSQEAISAQLMHLLASIVDRDTEENKMKQILKNAENRTSKNKKENDILNHIKKLGDKILDDQTLVNTLSEYRNFIDRVESELRTAKIIEDKIEDARTQYKVATDFCSWLFFASQDLAGIDHMYRFSIVWFTGKELFRLVELYVKTIELLKLREESKMKTRADKIINSFKVTFYRQIKQAMSEQHLFIFEFLMAIRMIQSEGALNPSVYDYFVQGKKLPEVENTIAQEANPIKNYLSEEKWKDILYLSALTQVNLWESFNESKTQWIDFITNEKAIETPLESTPQNAVIELILCKIIYHDKLLVKIQQTVKRVLSGDLTELRSTPSFKDLVYQSSSKKPIILLQTLTNPFIDSLLNYAKDYNNTPIEIISLGHGQGTLARKRVLDFRKIGGWVVLQNCHLYSSWMPELVELIEETELIPSMEKDRLSPEYRLWLSSESDPLIPAFILQRSVKCVYNPIKGIKAGMLKVYKEILNDEERLNEFKQHKKKADWNKLFMGLTFFHNILLERTRHGSIGWNGICKFTDTDFKLSSKALYNLLESSTTFPFQILKRATIEIYYELHILDARDKEYLDILLSKFYNDNVIYSNVRFCPKNDLYYIPNLSSIQDYVNFIEKLPNEEAPELLGLNENADYIRRHNVLSEFERSILALTRTNENKVNISELYYNDSFLKVIISQITQLQSKLPHRFNIQTIEEKFPLNKGDPMNAFLYQELNRYNALLSSVRNDLTKTLVSLQGNSEIKPNSEELCSHLLNNTVPLSWKASHLSSKGIGEWLSGLQDRVLVFKNWTEAGQPTTFRLPVFWNVNGFLRALKIRFARANNCLFTNVTFTFNFNKTQDSIGIEGLYLENADWDSNSKRLIESKPKKRYANMPTLWIEPVLVEEKQEKAKENVYQCPLYKGFERNTKVTAYEDDNFIMLVPLEGETKKEHWIERNVALMTEIIK